MAKALVDGLLSIVNSAFDASDGLYEKLAFLLFSSLSSEADLHESDSRHENGRILESRIKNSKPIPGSVRNVCFVSSTYPLKVYCLYSVISNSYVILVCSTMVNHCQRARRWSFKFVFE